MAVILRTHGGLGNQIFQILYGRLLAEKLSQELYEVHDLRYKHRFPRSKKLERSPKPLTLHVNLFSSLRLPKVFGRLFGITERPFKLFGVLYVDGYFQSAASYDQFSLAMIGHHLAKLRSELAITSPQFPDPIVHLRLGDFFKDRNETTRHVAQRLNKLKPNSSIITNDEPLLEEPALAAILEEKDCKLIPSSDLTAEQVLSLLSSYSYIDANDSTLVFWASVLGGAKTTLCDVNLKTTQELFLRALNGSKGS